MLNPAAGGGGQSQLSLTCGHHIHMACSQDAGNPAATHLRQARGHPRCGCSRRAHHAGGCGWPQAQVRAGGETWVAMCFKRARRVAYLETERWMQNQSLHLYGQPLGPEMHSLPLTCYSTFELSKAENTTHPSDYHQLQDLPIAKMPVSSGKNAIAGGAGPNTPGASTEPGAPSPAPAAAKPAAQELVVAPAPATDAAAPREAIAEAGRKAQAAVEAAPSAAAEPVCAPQSLHNSANPEIVPTQDEGAVVQQQAAVVAAAPAAEVPVPPQQQQREPVKPAAAGAGKKQGGGGLFACFGCFKA